MSIESTFVGLDYHKDSVRVCMLDESGRELFNRNRPNDVQAVAEKIAQFGRPAAVAIEACCGTAAFELSGRFRGLASSRRTLTR